MKKAVIFLVLPLMLVALTGCEGTGGKQTCCGTCAAKPCAAGDADAAVCKYCPKSQKLVGYEGTVHCDKCDADIPAGKWCAKCNRFMLEGTVKCGNCGEVPKGKYCAKCKKYAGVPGMAYCEHCKSPYTKADGCAGCKK